MGPVFELSFNELPSDGDLVRWGEVFGAERPLRIEIGVGNSDFLVQVARSAPGFNYLGFEYSRKRVVKFLKKVDLAGIDRIRILRVNATEVLDRICAPASVDHFYINHPDPWPKRRHARKRLIIPERAAMLARLLAAGGGLSLRTDAPDYARQMLEVLDATSGLVNTTGRGSFAPAPLEPHATPYERKFRAAGKQIFYLEYGKD
jgi:tRNA (guanine-N7-)-methyltransferase